MIERDSQRSRVYKADDVLEAFAKPLPSVADVEAYAKRLFKSKRLAKKYPRAGWRPPVVADGRRNRDASGSTWQIVIPRWARNEAVVLHELAHTISMREYGRHIAGHGWQYASTFLDVVKWMMGKAAHDALKASFKAHKVRFRKPVKRTLTDEQRAALAARLASARMQKAKRRDDDIDYVGLGREYF
jgi:putative metallohydrolase (TIGR04338 family)